MSVRGPDGELLAEVSLQRLRLGRRLDDDELLCHGESAAYSTRSSGGVNNPRSKRCRRSIPLNGPGRSDIPAAEGARARIPEQRVTAVPHRRRGTTTGTSPMLRPHGHEHGLHPRALGGRAAVRRGARRRQTFAATALDGGAQPLNLVVGDRGGDARDADRRVGRVRHRRRRRAGPRRPGREVAAVPARRGRPGARLVRQARRRGGPVRPGSSRSCGRSSRSPQASRACGRGGSRCTR